MHIIYNMSLFVGNVSKRVTPKQFEEMFKSHGKCKIDLRKRYAFVQYDSDRCAQDARSALHNMNFCGLRLNVEWSKNSGRFNENQNGKAKRKYSRSRSWRRDDRWGRRSPSFEKRSVPTMSDNEDIDTFTPVCPRDIELLRKLRDRREEGEMVQPDAKE